MSRTSQWRAGLAVAFAAALAAPAQAAMMGEGLAAGAPLVERVQFDLPFPNPLNLFFFGGHDYCWYDDGWRGPGWYWCGYGERYGYGYGGGEGFHGWGEHRYERDWHRHEGGGDFHHHDFGGGGGGGGGEMQHHHNAGGPGGPGGGGGGNHPGGGGNHPGGGGNHEGGGGNHQGGGGGPQHNP